eukprot:scaffold132_cov170-Amphora_coffeaeformis.AAC.48
MEYRNSRSHATPPQREGDCNAMVPYPLPHPTIPVINSMVVVSTRPRSNLYDYVIDNRMKTRCESGYPSGKLTLIS